MPLVPRILGVSAAAAALGAALSRADVDFPLNRRPGVDGSFQVYVSLGQAF